MKQCPQVEFRPRTGLPTETGWYWGRAKDNPDAEPQPWLCIRVEENDPDLSVLCPGKCLYDVRFNLHQFHWFGPVAMIEETSCR